VVQANSCQLILAGESIALERLKSLSRYVNPDPPDPDFVTKVEYQLNPHHTRWGSGFKAWFMTSRVQAGPVPFQVKTNGNAIFSMQPAVPSSRLEVGEIQTKTIHLLAAGGGVAWVPPPHDISVKCEFSDGTHETANFPIDEIADSWDHDESRVAFSFESYDADPEWGWAPTKYNIYKYEISLVASDKKLAAIEFSRDSWIELLLIGVTLESNRGRMTMIQIPQRADREKN